MAEFPDPLPAIRLFLATDAAVAALVTDAPSAARVYVGDLPGPEGMPRAAVVISASGGPPSNDYVRLGRVSFDVRAYGKTGYHARRVHWACYEALKHLERLVVTVPSIGAILLHTVTPQTGPLELRDPDTSWPFAFSTYRVLASESLAA